MKLKQAYNPEGAYFWDNEKGEVCGCIIGQIILALNPDVKTELQAINKDLRCQADAIHTKEIANFSDGMCGRYSVTRDKYGIECQILKDLYPQLNLEFPDYDSYELLRELTGEVRLCPQCNKKYNVYKGWLPVYCTKCDFENYETT